MKQFNQNFIDDIFRVEDLPKESGVYVVYRYKRFLLGGVYREVLYIGKADNLFNRVSKHEDWEDWENVLKWGEEIAFSYTLVSSKNKDNERVEATLINRNKPPLNVEYKNNFTFPDTIVICSGNHHLIQKRNTARKDK